MLGLLGWTIEGQRPAADKYVLIAAPHTSNWDFVLMQLYAAAFDIPISWLGKASLFRPPFGWLMRALGGVAVVRHENRNLVEAMAATFAPRDQLVIVVPAEGTRQRTDYWKSGFYHIARLAAVPIVPSYLDYSKKRGGFGPPLTPSNDIGKDMQTLRDFYAPMHGKIAGRFGPVRLKEEPEDN